MGILLRFKILAIGLMLASFTLAGAACSSVDANLKIFAEIEVGATAPVTQCTTTCTVRVFSDLEKQNLVLQTTFGSPRNCDDAFALLKQSWMVAEFDLADANICAQLGGSNPTELLCEVEGGGLIVNTYLGEGVFPFARTGCGLSGLDFTILLDNLLVLDQAGLASFTCDTLDQTYEDNECTPGDNTNPVCAALNGLTAAGASDCFL